MDFIYTVYFWYSSEAAYIPRIRL